MQSLLFETTLVGRLRMALLVDLLGLSTTASLLTRIARIDLLRWKNGVLSFQGIADMVNLEWFQQFPFLVFVSMGGGLLGAAFNWLRKALLQV